MRTLSRVVSAVGAALFLAAAASSPVAAAVPTPPTSTDDPSPAGSGGDMAAGLVILALATASGVVSLSRPRSASKPPSD